MKSDCESNDLIKINEERKSVEHIQRRMITRPTYLHPLLVVDGIDADAASNHQGEQQPPILYVYSPTDYM